MFIMEETKKTSSKADIRVVGVGGGGSNALETMITEGIQGVQFIAVNTDDQALEVSSANTKVQLGMKLTKGLGAGANPEIGRKAAVESYEELVKVLKGADMIFVTAGMGGGTGTGGTPLVAQAANDLGILTVGIVTKPFIFEGQKRMKQAEKGIRELRNYVDTLIIIPNEKLLDISDKDTPLIETFKMTDNILLQAVKGIAELVSTPGLINLDFADIKTIMFNKGMALMGRGVAEGSDRATKAIYEAISSPLLNGVSIKGATGMIVNITAGPSLSLLEVQKASGALTQIVDADADVIIGTVIDKGMGDKISVTVIVTGFVGGEETETLANSSLFNNLKPDKDSLNHGSASNIIDAEEEKNISDSRQEAQNHGSASNIIDAEEEKNISDSRQEAQNHGSTFESMNAEVQKVQNSETKLPSEEDKVEETKTMECSDKEQNEKIDQKNKNLSAKEMLLSKAKEYEIQKSNQTENISQDHQMDINWKETSIEESISSPFDSSLDFSDEDMI